MRDGEWTLKVGSESATFGLLDSEAALFIEAPDLGDAAIEAADSSRPRSDGVAFGSDFRGGRTITLELGIVRSTEAEVREAVSRLSRLWRGDAIRNSPGAVATLTARHAGRERAVYGRPRRFSENLSEASQGYATILADFAASDDVFYSPAFMSESIALVPPPGGGLLAPLGSPLATTESSDRSIGISVEGELPAWPLIEIQGPITNPIVEVVGRSKMEFRLTLAADQRLVVDTRPHARTIKRNGASVPGVITRASTRLSKAAIPPGSYEVALRGTSESGTAYALMRWQHTYPSL